MQSCNTTVAKQQSVLEQEIEQMRNESLRVNKLSDTILDILRPSSPCEPSCEQTSSGTVADSLRDIRTITEGSVVNLEGTLRIFEEQLGGLKLEY